MGKSVTARWMISLSIAMACAGCGDDLELGRVKGVVLEEGTPASGAMVEFHPEQGRPSTAMTDASGQFEMRFTPERMGALPGVHSVKVTIGQESFTALAEPGEPMDNLKLPEAITVSDAVTVEPGANYFELDVTEKTVKAIEDPNG